MGEPLVFISACLIAVALLTTFLLHDNFQNETICFLLSTLNTGRFQMINKSILLAIALVVTSTTPTVFAKQNVASYSTQKTPAQNHQVMGGEAYCKVTNSGYECGIIVRW
ncbi:hypothetical protein [Rheinheimera sp. 4Y26]|uniref:hypothetical protein n=1 Tax=Rheinheimera sp. 4Y26 TaxID=2977811 RepID=UPI0021B12BBA|nr:hypothetical protein [Rheinheimera sp. 4Y26]MCT6699810.1 hypothetical protein [Rheinheimera sp. 4Y26]